MTTVELNRKINSQKPVKISLLLGFSVTFILFILFITLLFKTFIKKDKIAKIKSATI